MDDVYPTRRDRVALLERQDPVVYWPTDRKPLRDSEDRLKRFEREGYLFVPELLH